MAIGVVGGRSNGAVRAKGVAASAQHADDDRARRFHEAALPHLDDLYTLARYLMRNPDDAEDAVQECYLRGLRYFDSYRGPVMKPWLLAIALRNRYCDLIESARVGLFQGHDLEYASDTGRTLACSTSASRPSPVRAPSR